jgi:hypothetical protein
MSSLRGQTTLDFAVGVSLFLLVLVFVFSFVPGLLGPLTGSNQDEQVVADRVGDRLAQDTLGSPERPYVLDQHCAVEFFSTTGSLAPSECRYTGQSLEDRLVPDSRLSVNVTVRGNVTGTAEQEPVCWADNDRTFVAQSDGACDVEFAAGASVPESSSTVTAQRVVRMPSTDLDGSGETLTVEVVVW